MRALIGPRAGVLLGAGLSTACGFAALGVALYAQHPRLAAAGGLFAAVGFVTGVVRMALPMAFEHLPAQARLAAGQGQGEAPSPLALMARATLAAMQQPPRSRAPVAEPAVAPPAAAAPVAASARQTDVVGA